MLAKHAVYGGGGEVLAPQELKDKSGFQHLKRTAAKKKLKQVAKDHSDARLFEEV